MLFHQIQYAKNPNAQLETYEINQNPFYAILWKVPVVSGMLVNITPMMLTKLIRLIKSTPEPRNF